MWIPLLAQVPVVIFMGWLDVPLGPALCVLFQVGAISAIGSKEKPPTVIALIPILLFCLIVGTSIIRDLQKFGAGSLEMGMHVLLFLCVAPVLIAVVVQILRPRTSTP